MRDPAQRARYLVRAAWQYFESEPDRALGMLKAARSLAKEIHDPCLLMHCEGWICNTLLFYLERPAEALDVAIKAAVEVHKPAYTHCAERIDIYRVLLDAYLYNDPVGYADEAGELIAFIETQLNPNREIRQLMQWARAYLALSLDNLDQALQEGLSYLECSQYDDFRLADAYSVLCEIKFWRGEWADILSYAQLGELHARRRSESTQRWLVEFLTWQAFTQRKQGDADLAARTYRTLMLEISRMGAKPLPVYYDALCAYYELIGDLDSPLKLRQRQVGYAIIGGSPYMETEARLRYCRLMAKMGLPLELELAAAYKAAERLKKPEPYLAKLHTIALG